MSLRSIGAIAAGLAVIAGGAGALSVSSSDSQASAAAGTLIVRQTNVTVADHTSGTGSISCQTGEEAIAGGASTAPDWLLQSSSPTVGGGGEPTGWHARAYNNTLSAATFTIYVICAERVKVLANRTNRSDAL